MPPPAIDPELTDTSAVAPDFVAEAATPPALDDASARLESALARLEALVEAGPLQSDLFRADAPEGGAPNAVPAADAEALIAERDAARVRERALEAAAAAASQALGRAMAQIRHALEAGGAPELDIDEEGTDGALDPASATPPATSEDDRS
jgi:hypothetical protein